MLKKLNGILRKNRGKGFEKSYLPLHVDGGVKNCQNHSYVINEWAPNDFDPSVVPLKGFTAPFWHTVTDPHIYRSTTDYFFIWKLLL